MSRNPTSNHLNASMFNFSPFALHPSPIELLILEPPNLSTQTSKFFASALWMHWISKFSTIQPLYLSRSKMPLRQNSNLIGNTKNLARFRIKCLEIQLLTTSMFNFSPFDLHPFPIELFDPTISEHRYHPKYQTILHSGYFPLLPKLPRYNRPFPWTRTVVPQHT